VERCPGRQVPTDRPRQGAGRWRPHGCGGKHRRSTSEHGLRLAKLTASTLAAMAATTAPPTPTRLGGRRAKRRSPGGDVGGGEGGGRAREGHAGAQARVRRPPQPSLSPGGDEGGGEGEGSIAREGRASASCV